MHASLTRWSRWLGPATHLGRDEKRLAVTLRTLSITFLAAAVSTLVLSYTVFERPPRLEGLVLLLAVIAGLAWCVVLVARSRLRTASRMLVGIAWLGTTAGMIGGGGLSAPSFSFYAVCIVAAGLLLGPGAGIVVAGLSAASGAVIGILEARGLMGEPVLTYVGVSIWWLEMVLFAATAGLVNGSMNRVREALAEAEHSESELAERNRELVHSLEEKQRAQEGEAILHRAMDQAGEAILVLDTDARVRYANAAAQALGDRVGHESVQSNPLDALGPADNAVRREIVEAVKAPGSWRGRMHLHGSHVLVDASLCAVTDADGSITSYAGVLRDVTHEVDLETKLHQSQKLEALGRLAGGVAHDFNNLLVVMKGHAEILARAAEDPELKASADEIQSAADQAAGLTGQLLAFGRRQVQRERVVNLNELVSDAASMLRRLVPENVGIELQLAPDLWPVKMDPGCVHQILMNLVTNARDAMPAGGRVRLATGNVEPHEEIGPAVELVVEDSGCGMDEETAERVFEPFFSTKPMHEGTGLGLATVYGIVEQCGGTIGIESRLDEGTALRIHLPRTEAEPTEEPADPRPAPGPRAGVRILVVEDNEPVRRLLRRILAGHGFEILEACDGIDALERLEEDGGEVDLVLTDVMMPRLDGPSLVARLRERCPQIGVIYSSGYAPEDLGAPIADDPLSDFVPKPFTDRELLQKLEALLTRARGRRE